MELATISPEFQIEIPRSVCERLDLKPGQQVHVILYDNRIELILVRRAAEMRGFLHGMPTDFVRDEDHE